MQEYYKVQGLDCYNDELSAKGAEKILNNQQIGTYLIRDSSFNEKNNLTTMVIILLLVLLT